MVRSAVVSKVTAGRIPMQNIRNQVTGGVILKWLVFKANEKYGKHAVQIVTAFGIEHVATVVNIRVMKIKVEMFVDLESHLVIVLFANIIEIA